MPNRVVELKRIYIVNTQVGNTSGLLRKILYWYWDHKTKNMQWGEILEMYRLLSEK